MRINPVEILLRKHTVGNLTKLESIEAYVYTSMLACLRGAMNAGAVGTTTLDEALAAVRDLMAQPAMLDEAMRRVLVERDRIRLTTSSRHYDMTAKSFINAIEAAANAVQSTVPFEAGVIPREVALRLVADVLMAPLVKSGASELPKDRLAPISLFDYQRDVDGDRASRIASVNDMRIALVESALGRAVKDFPKAPASVGGHVRAIEVVEYVQLLATALRKAVHTACVMLRYFDDAIAVARFVGWKGDNCKHLIDVDPLTRLVNTFVDTSIAPREPIDSTQVLSAPHISDMMGYILAHPSLARVSTRDYVGMFERLRTQTARHVGLAVTFLYRRFGDGRPTATLVSRVEDSTYELDHYDRLSVRQEIPVLAELDAITQEHIDSWSQLLTERTPELSLISSVRGVDLTALAMSLSTSVDFEFVGVEGDSSPLGTAQELVFHFRMGSEYLLTDQVVTHGPDSLYFSREDWAVAMLADGDFGRTFFPRGTQLDERLELTPDRSVQVRSSAWKVDLIPLSRAAEVMLPAFRPLEGGAEAYPAKFTWGDFVGYRCDNSAQVILDRARLASIEESALIAHAMRSVILASAQAAAAGDVDVSPDNVYDFLGRDESAHMRRRLSFFAFSAESGSLAPVTGRQALYSIIRNVDVTGAQRPAPDIAVIRSRMAWAAQSRVRDVLLSQSVRRTLQEMIRFVAVSRPRDDGSPLLLRPVTTHEGKIVLDMHKAAYYALLTLTGLRGTSLYDVTADILEEPDVRTAMISEVIAAYRRRA